ncbi:MAG: ABC transporter ATP-binding protein [Bacteriovorax sp.]|nr:ABC transporter ATP-binding protein [Bacteriovorax sp.]
MNIAVKVENLVLQFGDFQAVKNISFEVQKGEIFGFLGANGAGKTTTIRVLCGLLIPTSGSVEVAGIPFNVEGNADLIKAKVGYMSQKFTLYNDLTVEENISFTASLRKLPREYYEKRKKELFDFISFNKPANTKVSDLAGGMKQQVSLAAAILHEPEIIFLDEPTAGVSSAARQKFWDLIKFLAKEGKTIFVTSHYMDEVEQCDRIALMSAGELIALDSPAGLKKTTFCQPLYELISKESSTTAEIENISSKVKNYFESFESYGQHLHVSPKSLEKWIEFKSLYANEFDIKEINPSLEDVFIRLVEERER